MVEGTQPTDERVGQVVDGLASPAGGDRLAGRRIGRPRVVGLTGVADLELAMALRIDTARRLPVELAQVLPDAAGEEQPLLRRHLGVVDVVVAAQHDRAGLVTDPGHRSRLAAHDGRGGDRLQPAERLDRRERRRWGRCVEWARISGEIDAPGSQQVLPAETQTRQRPGHHGVVGGELHRVVDGRHRLGGRRLVTGAVDGAAGRTHRPAPAVPAVQLVVEAPGGKGHEGIVAVVVGLGERLDELGGQRRGGPALVGIGRHVELRIGREVITGRHRLTLEEAAPRGIGILGLEHVDAMSDRHVLGEQLDGLPGVQRRGDVLLDRPLPLRAVPEGDDEVGAHERERAGAQRRQRSGVIRPPLLEVAEPVGTRRHVDDRQERSLIGEA